MSILILKGGKEVAKLSTAGFFSKEIKENWEWRSCGGERGQLTVSWKEYLTFRTPYEGGDAVVLYIHDGAYIHFEATTVDQRWVTIEVKNPDDLTPLIEKVYRLAGHTVRHLDSVDRLCMSHFAERHRQRLAVLRNPRKVAPKVSHRAMKRR